MAAEPSKEVARIEPTTPAPTLSANRKLTALNVDEMLMVAEGFQRSQVFKKGRDFMTKSELFVIIMAGQELGIGPAQSVMGIRMIEGRPELSANLQMAALKASGKYDYRAEWFDSDDPEHAKYPSPFGCTVTVFEVATGSEVGATTFTMYDADRAGLLAPRGSQPSNYLKYPANMLFARAGSNASAFFTPDALMTRTYHTGEIEGDVLAPVPELPPQVQAPVPQGEFEEFIGAAIVAAEEEVVAEEEVDYFNPETEPPPKTVQMPFNQQIDPALVPEFARTEADQMQIDKWGDPVDTTPEPTVEQKPQERLLSPGQRGLILVRMKAAGLTEERLKEILRDVAGTPHIDRLPMRLVDSVLNRLKSEAEIKEG